MAGAAAELMNQIQHFIARMVSERCPQNKRGDRFGQQKIVPEVEMLCCTETPRAGHRAIMELFGVDQNIILD
jgi:hypothetical protein